MSKTTITKVTEVKPEMLKGIWSEGGKEKEQEKKPLSSDEDIVNGVEKRFKEKFPELCDYTDGTKDERLLFCLDEIKIARKQVEAKWFDTVNEVSNNSYAEINKLKQKLKQAKAENKSEAMVDMEKIKRDIINAWNEIDRVIQNLELSNSDLKRLRSTMKDRLTRVSELLGKHFTDTEAYFLQEVDIYG